MGKEFIVISFPDEATDDPEFPTKIGYIKDIMFKEKTGTRVLIVTGESAEKLNELLTVVPTPDPETNGGGN